MPESSEIPNKGKIGAENPTGRVPAKDKEFETRVQELARITREKGIGQIYGYIYAVEKIPYGAYPGRGFILGEEVKQGKDNFNHLNELLSVRPRFKLPGDLEYRWWYDHSNRQGWMVQNYDPPKVKWKTEEGGGIFRKKKVIEHEKLKTYGEKHGEEDWTQYTYFSHVIDPSKRPGAPLYANVAVPPYVAQDIDRMFAENVYFPDSYLKALYPGLIGDDPSSTIKRYPATELQVIDFRENPQAPKIALLRYPKQIPY